MSHQVSLDTLQGMVNVVLLETGKALRIATESRKPGKPQPSESIQKLKKLKEGILPGAVERFQRALDDLESDIVRAKAVMQRDLDELRAKRYAAENPPMPEVEPTPKELELPKPILEETHNLPQMATPIYKNEMIAPVAPMAPMIATEPANEVTANVAADRRPLTPPSSGNKSGPSNLSLNTGHGAPDGNLKDTAEAPDSAVDSLFGTNEVVTESANGDLAFDSMDFNDTSQLQHTDFDLSAFGNTQDLNMSDLQTANGQGTQNINVAGNTQGDLFGMSSGNVSDMMDLTSAVRPAEDNSFDDLFDFTNDDDMGMGSGGAMDHGPLDEDFFGMK
ncbi:hypothetical protein BJ878DRAFT_338492 [Calycina marina]|uniref:Uncharacterized protein n=1 Tax=Calycina marina TaxID=1763456 RepID=A0A9P7Z5K6_9HELO|nr:hypothetical protein BJ878DRAFT_338492 [Calycina marina]